MVRGNCEKVAIKIDHVLQISFQCFVWVQLMGAPVIMASVSPLPNTTAPIQRSGNLKGASFSFFNLFRISSLISILNPSPRCSLGAPPRDITGTRLCPLPAGSLMLLKAALPTRHARRTVTVNNAVQCQRCPAIIQNTKKLATSTGRLSMSPPRDGWVPFSSQ